MAPRETKNVKIDVAAHERLGQLQSALTSQDLPPNVEFGEMVSALIMHTTPRQVAAMLAEYWWYIERREEASRPDREET